MDVPTKAGLLRFLETAVDKGWINKNTGTSWKTAANRVLETVGEHDDISTVDVRAAVLQFNNRHPGMMSSDSLRAYEQRVTQAVSQYVQHRADPLNYKAPSKGLPSAKNSAKKAAEKPASPAVMPSPSPQQHTTHAAPDKPLLGTVTDTSLALPFPLRPGFLAQVVIPRDLTTAEADRLCAFIQTLAQLPAGNNE